MSKQTTFAATDAGHKFLELYAEPVVTNTYLKVAILVLSVVALALLALLYRAQTAASRLKPLVISVSDIGRGQVVNYADFSKVPVERVSKYYLARWAELYYGRNHATLQRDFAESLNFFSNELQSATLGRVTKAKTLETFLLDPSAPNVDIEIKAVVLDDTRQARIAPTSNSKRFSTRQATSRSRAANAGRPTSFTASVTKYPTRCCSPILSASSSATSTRTRRSGADDVAVSLRVFGH
jgi:type IV secretion system protein VirB5